VTVKAERAAQALLDRHGVSEPPTPITDLAVAEGIVIVREPFQDDGVSGVLLRESDRTMIIVNAANAPVRQRFTIAHEIGHFALHRGASMSMAEHVSTFGMDYPRWQPIRKKSLPTPSPPRF
jgi:Zn-dependent peptidase ImmA (M78 family)